MKLLLLIDLFVLVGFVLLSISVMKNQSGFFFDPYAGFKVMLFGFPVVSVVLNLIIYPILYGFNLNYIWVLTPLMLPIGFYAYYFISEKVNVMYYHKYIVPIKKNVEDILSKEGYKVSYIHGLLGKKPHLNGEMKICLSKDYAELFDNKPEERKRLSSIIQTHYPSHKIFLFNDYNYDYEREKRKKKELLLNN